MQALSLIGRGGPSVDVAIKSEQRSGTAAQPSSPPRRPPPRRQRSRESPGWYNNDGARSLDDFTKQLDTMLSRMERWQGRCAQNVVMALMRPTPLVLFVFNPMSLLLWLSFGIWWMVA